MGGLVRRGRYTRLASLPAVRLELDFSSFDEYVETRLGKATRKNLRRKFREVERAQPITLDVKTEIDADEAETIHALYEQVARRGGVHFEVFSKEYFLRLSERMPGQARYFIWRQADRVIAFSFCTVHEGAIYDNDLGLDEELASRLNLYHVTFRDIIQWALANGLRYYYSSPFNYDPKWHLRMDLVPLDLYARHSHRLVNFALRHLAPLVAPTRQEPLLKRFANAGEL
jgi:CelD/BcsL family acetyltransferase involved in cellulose biosynthesis